MITFCVLAFAVSACAGEDGGATADDAARQASDLAERTQQLAGDVQRTGRTLVEDPGAADKARERLRELEQDARDAAEQAEELPESTAGRADLQRAGERIAGAADALAEAPPEDRENALEDARSQLSTAADRLDEAASTLASELPDDVRRELDALREDLGSRP